MEASALVTKFRSRAFDTLVPYRWSDEEILDGITDAQYDYLRAVRGIVDATTQATCTVQVAAGTRSAPLDRRIIEVHSAYSTVLGNALWRGNIEDFPQDRLRKTGVPRFFITNEADHTLSLDCLLDQPDTLQLVVSRTAKAAVEDMDQVLEVPDHHALGLLYHVLELAYLKDDGEVYDAQRSAMFGDKWREFIKEAKREVSRSRGTRGTVAYGGI